MTILTVANLDGTMCACRNIQRFTEYWREDLSKSTENRSYNMSQSAIESMIYREGLHIKPYNTARIRAVLLNTMGMSVGSIIGVLEVESGK